LVIVETTDDVRSFEQSYREQDSIVIPILSDGNKHALQNRLSLVYIQMMDGQEFIIPYNHGETLKGHKINLLSDTTKYTYDKKLLDQVIDIGKTLDVNLLNYINTNEPLSLEQLNTNAHDFLNMIHHKKKNINDVIPVMKHLEYCRKVANLLRDTVEQYDISDIMSYQDILSNLSSVERAGLQTTKGMVYSQYNVYTATGRPSNRFGGLNFAALNKKDGSRKQFISRFKNGVLVEMDYDAYHLRLIADRIGYSFPKGSVHQHMAELYGVDYQEAKNLSFQYLYGYIPDDIKRDNEYFSKVSDYINIVWDEYKTKEFIVSDIYNKKIYRKNLQDMNPNKLFNYMIQLMETENNMRILEELLPRINQFKSRLVLYNYDSFLFDFNIDDGLEYLSQVKNILEQDGKYPVKVAWGLNYHEMKDITEKFK
tara:strand:+ start:1361 stop:2635 length:1275 start_codon:yes stop_codon:yes gene_type:complete